MKRHSLLSGPLRGEMQGNGLRSGGGYDRKDAWESSEWEYYSIPRRAKKASGPQADQGIRGTAGHTRQTEYMQEIGAGPPNKKADRMRTSGVALKCCRRGLSKVLTVPQRRLVQEPRRAA